jgi:hypothetical protein
MNIYVPFLDQAIGRIFIEKHGIILLFLMLLESCAEKRDIYSVREAVFLLFFQCSNLFQVEYGWSQPLPLLLRQFHCLGCLLWWISP